MPAILSWSSWVCSPTWKATDLSVYLYYPYLRGAGELTILGAAFIGAGLGFPLVQCFSSTDFHGRHRFPGHWRRHGCSSVLLKQEMLFPLLGACSWLKPSPAKFRQDRRALVGTSTVLSGSLASQPAAQGHAETKVVIRLWIISGILALLALATLKIVDMKCCETATFQVTIQLGQQPDHSLLDYPTLLRGVPALGSRC